MGGIFGGGHGVNTVDPQIAGMSLQTSCYGGGITIVYGTNRITGNLLDYDDFTAIPHTTTASTGKGGGGSSSQTSWTYMAGVILLLCEGPIAGWYRMWEDKAVSTLDQQWALVWGQRSQAPWATWASKHPAKAVAYAGMAYVVSPGLDLGASGSMKNFGFEITGFLGAKADTTVTNAIGIDYGDGVKTHFPVIDQAGINLTSPTQCAGMQLYFDNTLIQPSGYKITNGYTVTHTGTDRDGNLTTTTSTVNPSIIYVNFVTPPASGMNIWWKKSSYIPLDAWPAYVIPDFLSNVYYGALWDPANIGDLVTGPASFHTYCVAMGFAFSPVIKDQKPAADYLQEMLDATNSEAVWSSGPNGMVLKIIPYGDQPVTANGVSYIPATTPLYDLNYDDFLGAVNPDGSTTGSDPVSATRTSPADVYNTVPVSFSDRRNSYNTNTLDDPEPTDVAQNGTKKASAMALPCIVLAAHALTISKIQGQRNVNVRTQYTFNVSWKYMLLEPMQFVTITDPILQISYQTVRIISIDFPDESSEEQGLTIVAEEWPFGTGHAIPGSDVDVSANNVPNTATPPGDTNAPAIISLPMQYTQGGAPEIAIGASGGPVWGGCEVWVSTDNRTYERAGIIRKTATHGFITAAMGATGTALVDVSSCGQQLASVTADQANDLKTATYCDTEIFGWMGATLTGPGQYTLDTLLRGEYGTQALTHVQYSPFLLLDDAPLYLPLTSDRIGQKLYLKLLSFNSWGRATQALGDVQPYLYVPASLLASTSIANPAVAYVDQQTVFVWDRIPLDGIVYEVRLGSTWNTGNVVATVSDPTCKIQGNGTYWVTGLYGGVYSIPVSIVITGSSLVQNVVQTWDEAATKWSGTFTGGAFSDGTNLSLGGTTLWDSMTGNWDDQVGLWDSQGGISPAGSYYTPDAHIVDIGTPQQCSISCTYSMVAAMVNQLWDDIPGLWDSLTNMWWDGLQNNGLVSARVFLAISQDATTWGPWQAFTPNTYFGRRFKLRLDLSSADPTMTPILLALAWTVDMPDRIERFTNQSVLASIPGITITFAKPFQVTPNCQITVHNGQPNDVWVRDSISTSNMTGHFTNGGSPVARNADFTFQSF